MRFSMPSAHSWLSNHMTRRKSATNMKRTRFVAASNSTLALWNELYPRLPTIDTPAHFLEASAYIFSAVQFYRDSGCVTLRDWKTLYHATVCATCIHHGNFGVATGIFSFAKYSIFYRANMRVITPTTRLHRARFLLVARQLTAACRLHVEAVIDIAYRAYRQRPSHPDERRPEDHAPSMFTRPTADALWRSIHNGHRVWLDEFIAAIPTVDDCFATPY
jgi:hypothetical protein